MRHSGALAALLWGCGATYRVDPPSDQPTLVIARFSRVLSAGTESRARSVGVQVVEADGEGRFTLRPPRHLTPGRLHAELTVSRPGHRVQHLKLKGPEGGALTLEPTARFAEERVAMEVMRSALGLACGDAPDLDPTQCTLLRRHVAEREAWLAARYPEELAAAEAARVPPEIVLDVQAPGEARGQPVAAARMADGGWARVDLHDDPATGRTLWVLPPEGPPASWPLADGAAWSLLDLGPTGLSVLDAGAVKRLDGEGLRPLPLHPPPEALGRARALRDGAGGPTLAVVVADAAGERAELWRYDAEGQRQQAVPLPGMREPLGLLAAPDGATLVFGLADGPADHQRGVEGFKSLSWAPRAALLVPADGGPPQPLPGGFDLALPAEQGYVAIWLHVVSPEDEPALREGVGPLVARHLARRCPWAGDCGPVFPLADAPLPVDQGQGRQAPEPGRGWPMIHGALREVPGGADGLLVLALEGPHQGQVVALGPPTPAP